MSEEKIKLYNQVWDLPQAKHIKCLHAYFSAHPLQVVYIQSCKLVYVIICLKVSLRLMISSIQLFFFNKTIIHENYVLTKMLIKRKFLMKGNIFLIVNYWYFNRV